MTKVKDMALGWDQHTHQAVPVVVVKAAVGGLGLECNGLAAVVLESTE